MTAALDRSKAPVTPPPLDPDVARAQAEGMVLDDAKVSAPDKIHDGWDHHASSLERPRSRTWQASAIVIGALVLAAVGAAFIAESFLG